jgi:hypothetical protein
MIIIAAFIIIIPLFSIALELKRLNDKKQD